MKILIYKEKQIVNSYGGIEKCSCALVNMLAENGHEVTFLTSEKKQGLPAYKLNNNVKFINLGKIRAPIYLKLISKIFKKCNLGLLTYEYNSKKLKPIVEKHDLVITTGVNESINILYNQDYSIPHICMIHSKPEIHLEKGKFRTKVFEDHIIHKITIAQVLLESFKQDIKTKFNFNKIIAIGNSVETNVKSYDVKKDNTIICISTIIENKNQLLLLKAFNSLKDKYKDWNVELWGQTANTKYLNRITKYIQDNNLSDRVLIKGTTDEVNLELQKAKIFAFPTKYEGFSLALTEAMACKLPVVGLKSASCVNELVIDNKTGFLVNEDPNDFAQALEKLIKDKELRDSFGDEALKSLDKYSIKSINKQWLDIIDNLNKNKGL